MRFQKRKLLLVVCLVFVLMSSMLTGCGSSDSSTASSDSSSDSSAAAAAPAAGTKVFEDATNGIKFNYPESWGELEKGSDGMIALYTNQDSKDLITFNFMVTDNTEKADMGEYGKAMEEQAKGQFDGFKSLSNKSVKVSGLNGARIEFSGEMQSVKMKNMQLAFGNDKKLYAITVAGTESGYDKHIADIDNLIKSISVK